MARSGGSVASRAVPIGLAIAFGLVALVGLWVLSAVALIVFGGWGIVALALGCAALIGVAVAVTRRR